MALKRTFGKAQAVARIGAGVCQPGKKLQARMISTRCEPSTARGPGLPEALSPLGQNGHHDNCACQHKPTGFGNSIDAENFVQITDR